MNNSSKDVLCEKLLASLEELTTTLQSEIGKSAFDIEHNAESAEVFKELRRLERSLQQYTEKNAALMYVGFVGHFSAGKSSTINSLLHGPSADSSRITGLHPTDKAVTLITHKDNSGSLVGAHKRGEVEVGASLLEADLLQACVVVDTPGSGDPLVLEEMVRDFLPICDRIVYTFSAAVPLDTTDLPILKKIHKDLPFLPVRFVVTRADEFKHDRDKPLIEENVDKSRIDTFVGELISRIAASVSGLSIAQEDVLLVDNLSGFNVDALPEFVFPSAERAGMSAAQLHSHKVDYYQRSARKVREFYVDYVKKKCSALDSLISTASATREHFYDAVTMANSRLTESWQTQQTSITSKQKGNTDWVGKLASSVELSQSLPSTEPVQQQLERTKEVATQWARMAADGVIRSVSEELIAKQDAHVATLREAISRTNEAESFALPTFVADESCCIATGTYVPPSAISEPLRGLANSASGLIRQEFDGTIEGAERLREAIREKRVSKSLFESLQESITQLNEMVATFFKSVQLYRSGVLAMNARELAERAGIVRAIDELERTEVPDDKKEAWARRTVDEIFANRHAVERDTATAFDQLDARLEKLISTARSGLNTLTSVSPSDARITIEEEFLVASRQSDENCRPALSGLLASFNHVASSKFQSLRSEREKLVEERQVRLNKRMQMIRRKRIRRLSLFTLIGSAIGLLGYGGVYFAQQPFANNWTAAVAVGVLANFLTALFGWTIAWLTDPSKDSAEVVTDEYEEDIREIVTGLLRGAGEISRAAFVDDSVQQKMQIVIERQWCAGIDRVADRLLAKPFEVAFGQLVACDEEYAACREEYIKATTDCATKLNQYFARTENNLSVLAALSADIREEAIVPSFSMFENRGNELRGQLEELASIEFS